jgi:hypothetical protein
MSKEAKLAELRAKTDRELARYVTSELNLVVRLASESDRHSRIRAEQLYDEIARLLPITHQLGQSERRRLEAKLNQVKVMLDTLPALTQTA